MRFKRLPNLSKAHLPVLIFSAIVHLVSVVKSYAWADDWAFIAGYRTNSTEIRIEHVSGLRPVLQLIMDQSFGRISQYENLIFLRLISLIGLLLLIHQVMKLLGEMGYSKFVVFGFGVLINFLPTFWIYTNWASVFSYTWVCLLSLLSFSLFGRSKLLGLALIIFCFLIYQPAAVFSTFISVAYLVKSGKLDVRNRIYLLYVLVGSFIGFLIGRMTGLIVELPLKARTEIVDSPPELFEKIAWVVTRPVVLSMRPFIIESEGTLALTTTLVGFVLALCSFWQVSRIADFSLVKFGLYLILVYSIGLLPLIVIAENQIEFRTLPATSCFGLLFALVGAKYLVDKFSKAKGVVLLTGITGLAALTFYSHEKVHLVFIDSFRQNYDFIKSTQNGLNSQDLFVVITDSEPWPQRNNIGALSVKSDLQMPWVPIGEISQILRVREDQVVLLLDDKRKIETNGNLIDLRKHREQLN